MNKTSKVVMLADSIDDIVGLIGIGKEPTGSSDPYKIKRAATNVVYLLAELHQVSLAELIDKSIELYAKKLSNDNTKHDVIKFIMSRLENILLSHGHTKKQIAAVNAVYEY